MKLGSLFDGSGGFPLAGSMCGAEPVWAAEIEPYPIAVTRSRFPTMRHLGDISKVNGGDIEPVDIITFGSPCQDLSVAGKRAGLKHEANGDEETTRSGLFMEAVRIIKEMRKATNGIYPTFALWENVPGAFSSNKGEDFRIVCEELIKIVEPKAVMPAVPQNGWSYADSYCGDGWSLAYRVFDAQYWGVPQRRRRIHLVIDLRGQRARKVLFEREGVRGYFAESGTKRKATAGGSQNRASSDDRKAEVIAFAQNQRDEVRDLGDIAGALQAQPGMKQQTFIAQSAGFCTEHSAQARGIGFQNECAPTLRAGVTPAVVYSIENHPADSRVNLDETGKVQTLTGRMGTGGGNVPMVMHPVYCLQGNCIDRADTAGCNGKGWREDSSFTLNTIDRHAVTYCTDAGFFNTLEDVSPTLLARDYKGAHIVSQQVKTQYIVRRLTPTECARLQGFADRWGDINEKDVFTQEEYKFWLNVRNTHAAINGKTTKNYTEQSMLTWYNKLHTDAAEYKMWGNGIALPPALYCMQGMMDELKGERT